MLSPELVLWMSLLVKDAKGHHPTKPIDRAGAVAIAEECSKAAEDAQILCASFYLGHGFRESGNQLFARGDCVDHLWDSSSDEYKRTHPKFYQPNAAGKCRPGDGEPVSFGPYQERTQPKTWAEAVASFSRTLRKAEEICAHDDGDPTCTAVEVVATGRTRTKVGKAIARVRIAEAERIEAETLFRDDPRQVLPNAGRASSFTTTTSLSDQEAPHASHHLREPVIETSDSPDMSM